MYVPTKNKAKNKLEGSYSPQPEKLFHEFLPFLNERGTPIKSFLQFNKLHPFFLQ
uniref:Protein indeterminate-domain 9 n=1 Tax=Rhizophora mucronata TaxID=61149 RepID=A0A2P2IN67_RHIMU